MSIHQITLKKCIKNFEKWQTLFTFAYLYTYLTQFNNLIYTNVMKKILFLIAVLAVASCGSPKVTQTTTTTTTTTTTVSTDLSKYESGLIEYGYARSHNKGKAYTDALRNAQQNIATRLYRVVSAVDTDFAQDTENGAKLQSLSERSSRFVGVIDEQLITGKLAGEPNFTRTSDGIFDGEVEVLRDNSLVAKVQAALSEAAMSDDDAVRVKFEENKFREVYEKELADFRNRKQQNQ